MNPNKTEAIKRFLESQDPDGLYFSKDYYAGMEVHVNVAQDDGEPIEWEHRYGTTRGFTDNLGQRWAPIRIPYNVHSAPEYVDSRINFDLAQHAEAIGMTGFDWGLKCSRWFGFDFDAIIGHSDQHKNKLTAEQLKEVEDSAAKIPWITVRKSTSGNGIHLYVYCNHENFPCNNHAEHAAYGRAILGVMTALTGYDFKSTVDAVGGVLWVWARKIRNNGLEIIKKGSLLEKPPPNWKDHLQVTSGQRHRNLPKIISDNDRVDEFEELTNRNPKIPLDKDHKRVIDYLEERSLLWWWDSDHHMLITHTEHLQKAHEALSLKGYFKTNSPATNVSEQNCFAFPMRRGAWSVRRYSMGVSEDVSWFQDQQGWTRTFLNRPCDLATACRAYGGLEDTKGNEFIFRDAQTAAQAAQLLGVTIDISARIANKKTRLKQHRDGRLIVQIDWDRDDSTNDFNGYVLDKKYWARLFTMSGASKPETLATNLDDTVRHLVSSGIDAGWVIYSDESWRQEPLSHIRLVLPTFGLATKEVAQTLGTSVIQPWTVICEPFENEYPGNRVWNRFAPQLKYVPSDPETKLNYPTWQKILNHLGKGLDDAVKLHPWCQLNGIRTGHDYLFNWIASLFNHPSQPLPYLFLHGPENCGKSTLHEALSLLITSPQKAQGVMNAASAMTSESAFNGELEYSILCFIEELDFGRNKNALNRLKEWVVSPSILIHAKGSQPYMMPNKTHWIHTANKHTSCPVFTGDTRITMFRIDALDPLDLIPKGILYAQLEKEAPDFLAAITSHCVPNSNDRLRIPPVDTLDKKMVQELNQTDLERFIEIHCKNCDGQMIKMGDFRNKFHIWLMDGGGEPSDWSAIRVSKDMPPIFLKGLLRDGQHWIGNIWWRDVEPESTHNKLKLVERSERAYLEYS